MNFILRKDYQGIEFGVDYGIADADDGQRKGVTMTLGHSSDKGSLMVGVNYHKQDSVAAADRKFSREALATCPRARSPRAAPAARRAAASSCRRT